LYLFILFAPPCTPNPVRIPRPKIDKLACQAQGVGIFAQGANKVVLRASKSFIDVC
jgi:hypothetical protein